MATYKVPQDVEAEDKLLGPFSFRQCMYLLIVLASCAIAWVLLQLFLPLVILPLPFILFFGALALPLRKDQPMETYLAAIISFYLKPRQRLWQPDGIQSFIEITVPKIVEDHSAKDITQFEADRRLSYLADIVDSQGWAVRSNTENSRYQSSMNQDYYNEAQRVEDVFDTSTRESHNLDQRISTTQQRSRNDTIARMKQPIQPQPQQQTPPQQFQRPPQQQPQQPVQRQQNPQVLPTPQPRAQAQATQPQIQPQPQPTTQPTPQLTINPYPSMQQSVLQPMGQRSNPQPNPAQSTSDNTPSPDIINLANNSDLSIETIAHEAKRIESKEAKRADSEVSISLH